MADARVSVEDDGDQQFSHRVIDNGNPTIYRPTWLVLDDINIDLFSYFPLITIVIFVLFFGLLAVLAFHWQQPSSYHCTFSSPDLNHPRVSF